MNDFIKWSPFADIQFEKTTEYKLERKTKFPKSLLLSIVNDIDLSQFKKIVLKNSESNPNYSKQFEFTLPFLQKEIALVLKDVELKKFNLQPTEISVLKNMQTNPTNENANSLNVLQLENVIISKFGANKKSWFYQSLNGFIEKEMNEYVMPFIPAEEGLLHTNFIENFLNRYEKVYPKVKVLGPFYEDNTDSINKTLENIDLKKYDYLACFMNSSSHLNGSHWTAFWLNLDGDRMEFFDSLGSDVSSRPRKIIQIIADFVEDIIPNFKKDCYFNSRLFQTSGSDCGVYVCKFLQWKILNTNKGLRDFKQTVSLDPKSIANQKAQLFNIVNMDIIKDEEQRKIYQLLLKRF